MKRRGTTYQEFPGWRYHPTEPAQIVTSQEAADALGVGWSKNPHPRQPEAVPPVVGAAPGVPSRMDVTDDVSVDLAPTPLAVPPAGRTHAKAKPSKRR